LADALTDRAGACDLWLAPWWSDGHPDHDACGRVASRVAEARGVRLLSFLVWAWHWAEPHGGDLPWERCRRHDLDQAAVDRKRWAIQAFRSQIRPMGADGDEDPVLPPPVLSRLQRRVEVFVEGAG
jgi:LmbE family N-acetylglucosaminyl deacetylase